MSGRRRLNMVHRLAFVRYSCAERIAPSGRWGIVLMG
jgi:hypothetical protein